MTFKDGEVIVGSSLRYDPERPGFFISPADPKGNNLGVFVVSQAVSKVLNFQGLANTLTTRIRKPSYGDTIGLQGDGGTPTSDDIICYLEC